MGGVAFIDLDLDLDWVEDLDSVVTGCVVEVRVGIM